VEDVANELGVHGHTIRGWIKRPLNPCPHTRIQGRELRFDVAEVRAWMSANGVSGKQGRPPEPSSQNLEAAKLRKENALADKYEIQVERERGVVVPFAEVKSRWVELVTTAKNRLLGVPATAAPQCVGRDASEIQAILESRITEALSELSSDRPA
jgi:phage terminase Nu1 subunit (DNA packaging protein)